MASLQGLMFLRCTHIFCRLQFLVFLMREHYLILTKKSVKKD